MSPGVEALEASLLELCRIDSYTGEEGPLCDFVEQRVRPWLANGSVNRDGHSLVIVPSPERIGHEPHVVLAGHLDVVRTSHDQPPRMEGDRLYGPGAADMKSGLAVMLHLLQREASQPARQPCVYVFYEREEGPFLENRLGDLLDHFPLLRQAEMAVCLEPSRNVLQLGCMGSLHATVRFNGTTAHSARPWQGLNAVQAAGPFLTRIAAEPSREISIDGLEWREVMSVTMAHGGRGRNIVPDRFELNVNVRFGPGRTVIDAEEWLKRVVNDQAEVEVVDRSPSALPFRAHPTVQRLAACGVDGIEPKQAWTDVARFAQCGVPAVNLGPGTQSQAHQRNEYTERSLLHRGCQLFERWLWD